MSGEAAAFAAHEAIERGEWDRFLPLLLLAIFRRQQTPGYREWALAAAQIRVKTESP